MWTDRDRQLRQLRSCFQPPQPPSPLSFSLPPTISLYFYFPLTQKHTITATHTHTWRLHFQGHSVSSISPPCAVPCSGRLDKSNTNHALTNGTTKHPSRREDTHAYGDIAIETATSRKKNAARDWCQDCGKLLCGCDIYPASGFPRCFQCPVAVQCWNEAQIRQQRRVTQDPRTIIRAPPAMAVHRLSVKLLCINGARLRGLALRSAGCQSSHPDPKFAFDRLIIFPSLSRSSFFSAV